MTDNKRVTDSGPQNEIDNMIKLEQDPKVRLQLMVMNRINLSLVANTTTINHVVEKLEEHLEQFEDYTKKSDEIKNKGIGAWKVVLWGLGIVQMLVFVFITNSRLEDQAIRLDIANNRAEIAEVKFEQSRRAAYIKLIEDGYRIELTKGK